MFNQSEIAWIFVLATHLYLMVTVFLNLRHLWKYRSCKPEHVVKMFRTCLLHSSVLYSILALAVVVETMASYHIGWGLLIGAFVISSSRMAYVLGYYDRG